MLSTWSSTVTTPTVVCLPCALARATEPRTIRDSQFQVICIAVPEQATLLVKLDVATREYVFKNLCRGCPLLQVLCWNSLDRYDFFFHCGEADGLRRGWECSPEMRWR